jgi:hypothetical protein
LTASPSHVEESAGVDPADVPSLPAELDLGLIRPETATRLLGRHDNWSGTTTTGRRVFVKRFVEPVHEGHLDVGRVVQIESVLTAPEFAGITHPRLLGFSESTRTLVFDLLEDAVPAHRLLADKQLSMTTVVELGKLVAALHSLPAELAERYPFLRRPSVPFLLGAASAWVSLARYLNSSAATLAAYRLMQSDQGLLDALVELRRRSAAAEPRLTHRDLRLDQVLVADGQVYLTDWEELALGDPAMDVGTVIGQFLFEGVQDIVRHRDHDVIFHENSLSAADVVARGAAGLARVRPLITRFWRVYHAAARPADTDLAERATAFAGWHLFDRLVAVAANSSRLPAISRAAAGIGRKALLDPGRFVTTLGLTPANQPETAGHTAKQEAP